MSLFCPTTDNEQKESTRKMNSGSLPEALLASIETEKQMQNNQGSHYAVPNFCCPSQLQKYFIQADP